MTLPEILTTARAAGIVLEVRGNRLHVEAAPGMVTPELRAALVARKPDLLAVLWRFDAMCRLAVTAPRAVVYARLEALGGPGHCFSCGDPHEHPEAYGRCGPCDIASDVFYATRHAGGDVEAVA